MTLAVAQVGGQMTTQFDSASATFGSPTTTGSLIVAIGHFSGTDGNALGSDTTDNKSNSYTLGPFLTDDRLDISAGALYFNNPVPVVPPIRSRTTRRSSSRS